jgi:hypothetical protein
MVSGVDLKGRISTLPRKPAERSAAVREAPAAATEKDPGTLPSSPLLSKISAAAGFQPSRAPGQCQDAHELKWARNYELTLGGPLTKLPALPKPPSSEGISQCYNGLMVSPQIGLRSSRDQNRRHCSKITGKLCQKRLAVKYAFA